MSEKEKAGSMKRVSEIKFEPDYVAIHFDIANKRIATGDSVMECDSISYYPASSEMAAKIEAAGFVIHVGKDTVKIGSEVFVTQMEWGFDSELQTVNNGESEVIIKVVNGDFERLQELNKVVARHWKFVALGLFTIYARQIVR